MADAKKIGLLVVLSLTAAMTLVAGAPHFTCRCPNGQVRLFCFGRLFTAWRPDDSRVSNCCCGGGCCVGTTGACCCNSPAGSEGEEAFCCSQDGNEQVEERSTNSAAQFTHTCCTKTLAQLPTIGVGNSKVIASEDLTLATFISLAGPLSLTGTDASHCSLSWQDHCIPPPTDLVSSFQLLTI